MSKSIFIYSTPTCHYCQMTKEFLKDKGIPYTDYNVAEDATRRDEMIKKSGQMGVPFIVFKDEKGEEEAMVGFNEPKLKEILGL